jgi:hypothetical protein
MLVGGAVAESVCFCVRLSVSLNGTVLFILRRFLLWLVLPALTCCGKRVKSLNGTVTVSV